MPKGCCFYKNFVTFIIIGNMAKKKKMGGSKGKAKEAKSSRKAPQSFFKEFELSSELSEIVGKTKATMQEVIKNVWKYIKDKGLQVKREINADEKLKKLFGKDKITMFELPKIIKQNLKK